MGWARQRPAQQQAASQRATSQRTGLPDTDATGGQDASLLDQLVDEVLPVDLDWRGIVRRHPLFAIGAAAGLGYLLGSRHGREMLDDLLDGAVAGLSEGVDSFVGRPR